MKSYQFQCRLPVIFSIFVSTIMPTLVLSATPAINAEITTTAPPTTTFTLPSFTTHTIIDPIASAINNATSLNGTANGPLRDNVAEIHYVTDALLFEVNITTFMRAFDSKIPSYLDWQGNGCDHVMDVFLRWNFKYACRRLDFGYHNYKLQKRFTPKAKSKVDMLFRHDTWNECARHIHSHGACKLWAITYFELLKHIGHRPTDRE